jgi:two-component system, OmpR family, phosphate regulon response regulator PhoB
MNRVLVVDDEKWIRFFLEDYFEDQGYEVQLAPDLKSARDFLRSDRPPHIMVLDIELPDGEGVDLLSEVRSNERTKNLPVVMMSADSIKIEEGKDELHRKGASTCVLKPFNLPDLQELIRNLLGM